MTNPKYLVNIYYEPLRVSGQQLVQIAGVTQSVPTYTNGYFVASMPEIRIAATGTSYETALSALLLIATASSTIDPGNGPYSFIRTY